MALTLYDFLPSGNGYKVRLLLWELGLEFSHRHLDIVRGDTHEPWFLAKNPIGQIPVLELEDGTCLLESTAILLHVAQGTHLLPDDELSRTRVLQWLCFEQTNIDGVISRARFRRMFPDAIPTAPHEFEAWWAQGKATLQVLEDHLQNKEYFVGDRFTVADIGIYAYSHKAEEGDFDLRPYPALRAFFQRVETRPTYKPIEWLPPE